MRPTRPVYIIIIQQQIKGPKNTRNKDFTLRTPNFLKPSQEVGKQSHRNTKIFIDFHYMRLITLSLLLDYKIILT